jgi:hypothetical protein
MNTISKFLKTYQPHEYQYNWVDEYNNELSFCTEYKKTIVEKYMNT